MHPSRYSITTRGPSRNRSSPLRSPVLPSRPILQFAPSTSSNKSQNERSATETNRSNEAQPFETKASSSAALSYSPWMPKERLRAASPSSPCLNSRMSILRQQSEPQFRSDSCVPLKGSVREPSRGRYVDSTVCKLQQQIDDLNERLNTMAERLHSVAVRSDTSAHDLDRRCGENQAASIRLCDELEARLTNVLKETQSEANALFNAAEKSWKDQIRVLGEDAFERNTGCSSDPITNNELFVNEMCEKVIARGNADPQMCELVSDKHSLHNEQLVNEISEKVIARVNADPQMRALVDSQHSLQDSFSKLMVVLENAAPPGRVDEEHRLSAERNMLYDLVLATQKTCKSMSLELRQLRQRRNQDCTDNELRFNTLEGKVRAISDISESEHDPTPNISADSASGKSILADKNTDLKLVVGQQVEVSPEETDACLSVDLE